MTSIFLAWKLIVFQSYPMPDTKQTLFYQTVPRAYRDIHLLVHQTNTPTVTKPTAMGYSNKPQCLSSTPRTTAAYQEPQNYINILLNKHHWNVLQQPLLHYKWHKLWLYISYTVKTSIRKAYLKIPSSHPPILKLHDHHNKLVRRSIFFQWTHITMSELKIKSLANMFPQWP